MSENGRAWWRGSFPMWIVVGLLSLIWFGIKRTLNDIDDLQVFGASNRATIAVNSGRISVLEVQAKDLSEAIKELRRIQTDSLIELKSISATLKK